MGFGVWGLGFGVWGLGFGVWGGAGVDSSCFGALALGNFAPRTLGFRACGVHKCEAFQGFRVWVQDRV